MKGGGCSFISASVVGLALGVLLMVPSEQGLYVDTVRFWIGLVPELLGRPVQHPPLHRRDFSGTRLPPVVEPLPDDLQASDKDWRSKFETAFKSRPVVVRRMVQQESSHFSDLLKHGSSEGLRKLFDETKIPVFTHMTQDKSAVNMDFGEYMDRCKQRSAENSTSDLLYARAVHDSSGTLMESIDASWIAKLVGLEWGLVFTKFMMPQKGHVLHIFPGSYPTWTQCHCDITTSIYLMVEGRKTWRFYAPSQTPFLYPYGQLLNSAFNTAVDVHHPDLGHFPEFAKSSGYEVTLEAGDVLFFPSMWWHGVENLDAMSIGLDLSIIDVFGSFRRNPIFTISSLGNPNLIMATLRGWISGKGLMSAFFDSYLVEDSKISKEVP